MKYFVTGFKACNLESPAHITHHPTFTQAWVNSSRVRQEHALVVIEGHGLRIERNGTGSHHPHAQRIERTDTAPITG